MELHKKYSQEITDLSKQELFNFMEFVKTAKIDEPYLIGGWAVYSYTKGLGSVDIDFVFETKSEINRAELYFTENKYKLRIEDADKHYYKVVAEKISGVEKEIEIWFDTFHFGDRNMLLADERIEVPWQLLEQYHNYREIGNVRVKVPAPELLLIYKVMAMIDREWKIADSIERMAVGNRARLRAKAAKDMADINGMVENTKVDYGTLEKILSETGFGRYFWEKLRRIGNAGRFLKPRL